MYSKVNNLVIAFHGCDKKVRDSVVNGANLKPSTNDYDWLGHGVYFWESDPVRAYEWAVQLSKRKSSSIVEPAVLGAVIDLGRCLDMSNRKSIITLQTAYEWLKKSYELEEKELPRNENIGANTDWLKRFLDCAVIQAVHNLNKKQDIQGFDSVRSMFTEGCAAYSGSGFKEKTHVQICIVNPNCVKGYFVPRTLNSEYALP